MSVSILFKQLEQGDRLALSKAITLVESQRPTHRKEAEELIQMALASHKSSVRIAITGSPGVGKSTFINSLGTWLMKTQSQKVCVLAIDPSSQKNKGSILGDKTRMDTLSAYEEVFIRPTPSGGALGGLANHTREAMLLCEAAGYNTLLVETVGVGQNEYLADKIVDCMLLLLLPNSGDELQGIKRGIMELADIVVLNKADSTDSKTLKQAVMDVKNALDYMPEKFAGWRSPVLQNSLNHSEDAETIWNCIQSFVKFQKENGFFEKKREEQKVEWFHQNLLNKLQVLFFEDEHKNAEIEKAFESWQKGDKSLSESTEALINSWIKA